MPATYQPLVFQYRAGPEHFSWENQDPWVTGGTAVPERDGVLHLFGACSWHDADDVAMRPILTEARRLGFIKARWERIDPITRKRHDVEVILRKE